MNKKNSLLLLTIIILVSGCTTINSGDVRWDDLIYKFYKFNTNENFNEWDITHFYAAIGTKKEMQVVIEYSDNLEVKDLDGNTPVMIAQRYNNIEAYEALLEAGCLLNWTNSFDFDNSRKAHDIAFSYGYFVESDYGVRKKEIPEVNMDNLSPPDLRYDYFSNAKNLLFEPNNKEFSLINCWWLSESSFLAYAPEAFAKMTYAQAGFSNFKFISIDDNECMVVWDDEKIIISFRGTEQNSPSTVSDVITDIRVKQELYEKGGYVHTGFHDAFNTIWSGDDGLGSFIESIKADNIDRKIWITGHSLGGALASFCFTKMEDATGLYTFGAPKVGNAEFLHLTDGRSKWRVTHNQDPVPRVPITLTILNRYYYNLGKLIYVGKYGEVIDMSKTLYSRSHINYTQDFIEQDIRKIADHMPINYSVKIWNYIVEQSYNKDVIKINR